ncbi:MAG: acyl carrier protein [Thermodesulfobacteriota bacterium]|nr:acyl carrier protein [Thermodesulfobacteriota bacterium]
MNEDTIQERVKEVMAGIFSMDPADIGPHSSLRTIKKWDSLQHVNLIIALEQAFGLRIAVSQAVEMTSFPSVCRVVAQSLGEAF